MVRSSSRVFTISIGPYFPLVLPNSELKQAKRSTTLLLKKSSWSVCIYRFPVKICLGKTIKRKIKHFPLDKRLIFSDFITLTRAPYHTLYSPITNIDRVSQHGNNAASALWIVSAAWVSCHFKAFDVSRINPFLKLRKDDR